MYVIHWTRHSRVGRILKNGLTPRRRTLADGAELSGIWVYPYGPNRTLNTRWRSVLKSGRVGDYNGIVFRLADSDFPLVAGNWISETHVLAPTSRVADMRTLRGRIPTREREMDGAEISKRPLLHFEIILLRRVVPSRIEFVVSDRAPHREPRVKRVDLDD
jgi:hypothetical protein